ncbi:type II secretion system F family protein [Paraburkholderia phosphatilytica]|uniref:type II secretion system F family protein n=1 Tax=Paraburkholderia phosphatilytica TaxID=2282883 RepID=UPI000E53E74E|nr:type II secretion system F family protein [Paraburkholderia phosphatilytica]
MASAAALIGALALVCVACALFVWQRGVVRQSRVSTERFIDSRTARAQTATAGALPQSQARTGIAGQAGARGASAFASGAMAGATVGVAGARGQSNANANASPNTNASANAAQTRWHAFQARGALALEHAMIRAGVTDARVPALLALAATCAACLWAARARGGFAALAMLVGCGAALAFWFSARTRRRRQKIVRQLPAFLDGIVRLIVLGNSVPAAFQASLLTTDAPLRECLDHVSRMLRTGVEIDRALDQVAAVYRARELELVGAVLRLSVKYGGRADVMLDRMASFMRDLEQAERELSALTAETRLSAWVLTALPIGIGGMVIATNPEYFNVMWASEGGRDFIYAAFGLQALGAWLLYRLARVKG